MKLEVFWFEIFLNQRYLKAVANAIKPTDLVY